MRWSSAWFMTHFIFERAVRKTRFKFEKSRDVDRNWPRDHSARFSRCSSQSFSTAEPTTEVLPKTTTDLLDGRAVFRPGMFKMTRWHQWMQWQTRIERNLPTFNGFNLTYLQAKNFKERVQFFLRSDLGIMHVTRHSRSRFGGFFTCLPRSFECENFEILLSSQCVPISKFRVWI